MQDYRCYKLFWTNYFEKFDICVFSIMRQNISREGGQKVNMTTCQTRAGYFVLSKVFQNGQQF